MDLNLDTGDAHEYRLQSDPKAQSVIQMQLHRQQGFPILNEDNTEL